MSISDECPYLQAGNVSLATLDYLYKKVVTYVKDNYPDKTFWLDAGNSTAMENESSPVYQWSTGAKVDPTYITRESGIGLMLVPLQNEPKMVETAVQVSAYFICEGLPEVTERKAVSPSPSFKWVSLGTPSRRFGFSTDKRSFPEAKDACASVSGNVRLAILDTLFTEVADWIYRNERSKHYWVDVSRPKSAESSGLLWGDGQSVRDSLWKPGKSLSGDWAARIRYVSSQSGVYLEATTLYMTRREYLCEQVPEVSMDWVLLGFPGKLFGFSRTPSWGLPWARRACLRHAGDVTMATLDTHFPEVMKYIADHYPTDEFWVDALRTGLLVSTFAWANGQSVTGNLWMTGEPASQDTLAIVRHDSTQGVTALSGLSDPTKAFHFICQGNPNVITTESPTTEATTLMTMTTTESPAVDCMGNCGCNATTFKSLNLSHAEVQKLVEAIQRDLQVDTSTLSATVRKRTSAPDSRPSAQATGYGGIVLLVIPFVLIIVPDLISLIGYLTKRLCGNKARKPSPPNRAVVRAF
ncbi:hypothetical protein ACOMHN_016069 [Nucella lapillus]